MEERLGRGRAAVVGAPDDLEVLLQEDAASLRTEWRQ
jgi:hypothetical protein